MKAGWQLKKLGEICDLQNGYAFKSNDYVEFSNTLNIRMSSIRPDGSFDSEHNQRFLPDSYASEYKSFLLGDDDLIIAMTDMAGDPKILGVPTLVSNKNGRNFLMNQRVGKLFGFSEQIYVPYLRYFLTSPLIKELYKNKGAGGLQINISKADILSVDVPFSSIEQQQRIVAILDQAFEGIAIARANAEHNLQNARALFESHLQSVFTQRGEGWTEKTLSEVCEIKPPKNEAKKLLNNSDLVSFAPMEDLGINQKYFFTNKQRALNDVAGSYTYFAEGDVLLAKITPCFENGKLGIAKNLINGIGFGSSEYIVFRPNKELSNEFLYYFLSRKRFIEEGAARMSGAVGHKRVSKEFIESYKIAFPLLETQKEIVKKIDALSKETQRLETLYQRKIECLDELKKSLLQQAFAGEL